jgi:hypothetical protein
MATTHNYASVTPRAQGGSITVSGTRAGSEAVDIFIAGTAGSRVESVYIKAYGVTTASVVKLGIYDGAAWLCIKEVPVTAVSGGADEKVQTFEAVVNLGIVLAATQKLQAVTGNGDDFYVTAFGADF